MSDYSILDEEMQYLVPGTHPDDVDLEVPPPRASTDGEPPVIRLDEPGHLTRRR